MTRGRAFFQHIERFKEMVAGYTVRRSRGGNLTTEEEIRQGYRNAGWDVQPPSLDKKNSQIDRLIAVEENSKLYIFEDLWQILAEISNCMWKLDENNQPMNEIDNEAMYHLTACLRYILSDKDFAPETVETGKIISIRLSGKLA